MALKIRCFSKAEMNTIGKSTNGAIFFFISFSKSLAVLVSLLGTLGDLVQSRFKRIAQVKDSGSILPGHGGMFDRLDSVLFVAPYILLILLIISYVS